MDFTHRLTLLEQSQLAAATRHALCALSPIVEIVHICGLAVLVGAVALFDLRSPGLSRTLSGRALGRHLLPWAWAAFLLIVPSGIAMLSAHATEFAANPSLRVKLVRIACAGLNALAFHRGVRRTVALWDVHLPAPVSAKAAALAPLALWAGVISCGRLIANLCRP